MKINLAKSAGFCFGVKRALDIAFKLTNSSLKVYMLGDMVHNEDVIKEIQKSGIKKITRLSQGKNSILLIRAHGASSETIKKARYRGYKIVDATCPMVKEIHKTAKTMEKKKYQIIVIGDKDHDEVRGIIGQLKTKAIIIENPQNIPFKKIKMIKKAAVLSQSTQNLQNVLKIVDILKKYIKKFKFFNTICRPTKIKQEEITTLPLKNDTVIIIGSKTSANTRRLFEIARSLNKHSYWVQSKKEIRRVWFKNARSVGVTSGASTPDRTTREIIEHIKTINLPF